HARARSPVPADHLTDMLELLGHALIGGDDVVEGIGDLAGETRQFGPHPYGKLGGQAQVPEVTGVWKDLTERVNSMASNLTAQVRNIAEVTIAVAN
ncbi:hypothetical protein AB9F45_35690, partial [Rhizobium leguminosarum]|uniref:hypothetical protein n=1 Tax=Rhizobium leguminosarum TaxID=384 RepID=UPI003F9EAB6E